MYTPIRKVPRYAHSVYADTRRAENSQRKKKAEAEEGEKEMYALEKRYLQQQKKEARKHMP